MEPQPRIFGTDGIRDRAGSGFLTAEEVERIVAATVSTLQRSDDFPTDFPNVSNSGSGRILIGRDTRASGETLERTIAAAFARAGFDIDLVGVIPTPGVAYLAAQSAARLGVMISASHNPAEYNGIKFLAPTGAKMSDAFEDAVSDAYWARQGPAAPGDRSGAVRDVGVERVAEYVDYLVRSSKHPERCRGRTVVLDTANGATCDVARRVFAALGARVVAIGDCPDGQNINEGCGALHPVGLAARIVEEGAFCGFAFDGDGDRMIPLTETGAILDGDHVLAIAARDYQRRGELPNNTVVTTVMANIGLEKSLVAIGCNLLRTAVGDRFVYESMVAGDHPLGGEQSGHLIFLDHASTGDGVLAALRLLDCLGGDVGETLDAAASNMTKFPQTLLNCAVSEKVPLESIPGVQSAVAEANRVLAGDVRVVLRYSGTELLARVMVEGPEQALIERLASDIRAAIVREIGVD